LFMLSSDKEELCMDLVDKHFQRLVFPDSCLKGVVKHQIDSTICVYKYRG